MYLSRYRHQIFPTIFIIINMLFLGGCITLTDFEASHDQNSHVIGVVRDDENIGQSFISRRQRLNSIFLWLNLETDSIDQNGILNVNLYYTPDDQDPIAVVPVSFGSVAAYNPVKIDIPPHINQVDQRYFIELTTSGGAVQVFGKSENSYPYGQTYINRIPANSDIAFRLTYDYNLSSVFLDIKNILRKSWLIFPIAITLFMPGWLLINISGLNKHFDFGETTALSISLSLALIPVLMTWTTPFNLSWSSYSISILAGILLIISIYRLVRQSKYELFSKNKLDLALVGIFAATLFVRLAMIRDLTAPAWVDSVHHGVITRLILEKGGFPETYLPYINIGNAHYHPGFHSILAVFLWLSNLEIHTGMLVFGQVINALSIFSVYLFTKTFTKDRTAAIFAAIITGFFSPMPAYYTSWGRYTQLIGLLIFPAVLALIKLLLDKYLNLSAKKISIEPIWLTFITAIACGGVTLTHYRVAAFLFLFIGILFVFRLFSHIRSATLQYIWYDLSKLTVFTFIAILITLPWLPSAIKTLILPKVNKWTGVSIPAFSDFSWGYLTSALGQYTLVLAIAGTIWGLVQRKKFPLVFSIWIGLLFFVANLGALRLPGGGLINNTSVEIALFVPISALCGYLLSQVFTLWRKVLPQRWHPIYNSSICAIIVVLIFIAITQLMPILNPVTILYKENDGQAIAWINKNVPQKETFLINPFAWGYGLYAGNDGGYWITPLTGNKTIPPPVLYGLDNSVEKIERINEISQFVIDNGSDADKLYKYLQSFDIRYIYIGDRGGVLSAKALNKSNLFEQVYNQNSVGIFKLTDTQLK